jgi:hypothetical protein
MEQGASEDGEMKLTPETVESITAIHQASKDDIIGCWFATIEVVLKSMGLEVDEETVFAIAAHQVTDLKNKDKSDSIFNPDYAIN